MVELKNNVSMTMMAGAAMVILGVALKNGGEQAGRDDSVLGPILFIAGWLAVAYGMSMTGTSHKLYRNKKGNAALLAAAMIVGAVFAMKAIKKGTMSDKWQPLAPVLFVGGWLLMGYLGSLNNNSSLSWSNVNRDKAMWAVPGVALVLSSMMGVLPYERKERITDTMGMPMFSWGWMFVIIANAMKTVGPSLNLRM